MFAFVRFSKLIDTLEVPLVVPVSLAVAGVVSTVRGIFFSGDSPIGYLILLASGELGTVIAGYFH
jgi:hypothetical protein